MVIVAVLVEPVGNKGNIVKDVVGRGWGWGFAIDTSIFFFGCRGEKVVK